jgi:DNA replication protein DnaC
MNTLTDNLNYLKITHIPAILNDYVTLADQRKLSKLDFFQELIQAEVDVKQERAITRRIKAARFPYVKTLETYKFHHPTSINADQVKHLFRLNFLENNENVIFCGGVGMGKTHLAIALGHAACTKGAKVLFTTAVDIINRLTAAQKIGELATRIKTFTRPDLLIMDELGYCPIDKHGADMLFQVISARYERASTIITTNRAYKDWQITFNNDPTVTSAILDRVLHHSHTVVIEGTSYRMKDTKM